MNKTYLGYKIKYDMMNYTWFKTKTASLDFNKVPNKARLFDCLNTKILLLLKARQREIPLDFVFWQQCFFC